MAASVHDIRKSLHLLTSASGELVKTLSLHQAIPVPKLEFDELVDESELKPKTVRKNIVSKEIYTKILNAVTVIFASSDSFYTLPQITKAIYNKGIRPEIPPEDYVEIVLQAINEVRAKTPLETVPDVEGTKYRRNSNG